MRKQIQVPPTVRHRNGKPEKVRGHMREMNVPDSSVASDASAIAGRTAYVDPFAKDVDSFGGTLDGGYDADDINDLAKATKEELGYDLVCVWDTKDEYGYGGDSQLAVRHNGQACPLPKDLAGFLYDHEGEADDIAPYNPDTFDSSGADAADLPNRVNLLHTNDNVNFAYSEQSVYGGVDGHLDDFGGEYDEFF